MTGIPQDNSRQAAIATFEQLQILAPISDVDQL